MWFGKDVMEDMKAKTLKVDQQFKNLIPPLSKSEYLQLEENLIVDGCRDPITVWKDIIVDGHNRYEICMRHEIPFSVLEKDFVCREEAIAWICSNQLGRRNISEETRKFLIGKQYEAEKVASRIRNPHGWNQYSDVKPDVDCGKNRHAKHHTAVRIAEEHNIARGTVEKYAIYSRAMDTLAEKEPDIVPKILSGQYKIAHKNVVELSKLSPSEIRKVGRRIEKMQEPFIQYNKMRDVISASKEGQGRGESLPSVKDMPVFDPDADINVLTLTIPSWYSSINRVRTRADLSIISAGARSGLIRELHTLVHRAEEMLAAMEEE